MLWVVLLAGTLQASSTPSLRLNPARGVDELPSVVGDEVCMLQMQQSVYVDASNGRSGYERIPELDGSDFRPQADSAARRLRSLEIRLGGRTPRSEPEPAARRSPQLDRSHAPPPARETEAETWQSPQLDGDRSPPSFRDSEPEALRSPQLLRDRALSLVREAEPDTWPSPQLDRGRALPSAREPEPGSWPSPRLDRGPTLPVAREGVSLSSETAQPLNTQSVSVLDNSNQLVHEEFSKLMEVSTELNTRLARLEKLETLQNARLSGLRSELDLPPLIPPEVNDYMLYIFLGMAACCCFCCCGHHVCHHLGVDIQESEYVKSIMAAADKDGDGKIDDDQPSLALCCHVINSCNFVVLSMLNVTCIIFFLGLAVLWEARVAQEWLGYVAFIGLIFVLVTSIVSALFHWCAARAKSYVKEIGGVVQQISGVVKSVEHHLLHPEEAAADAEKKMEKTFCG